MGEVGAGPADGGRVDDGGHLVKVVHKNSMKNNIETWFHAFSAFFFKFSLRIQSYDGGCFWKVAFDQMEIWLADIEDF